MTGPTRPAATPKLRGFVCPKCATKLAVLRVRTGPAGTRAGGGCRACGHAVRTVESAAGGGSVAAA